MSFITKLFLFSILFLIASCGAENKEISVDPADVVDTERDLPFPQENFSHDLLATKLDIDLQKMEALATIKFEPNNTEAISFEVGDLEILSVSDALGKLNFEDIGEQLNIGLPKDTNQLFIKYKYQLHNNLEGVADNRFTFTWPYNCGNIFPCNSFPNDGLKLDLEITGAPEGEITVYTKSSISDAPSYQLAWATGKYQYTSLGITAAGTEVGFYVTQDQSALMQQGTINLRQIFEWYEQKLGSYLFGSKVASVAVDWAGGGYGGIEHHPFWHISSLSMTSQETHAHEAAHGWFGNGIRLACWEDFVLSEGTTNYLTARALEDVAGSNVSDQVWQSYRQSLDNGIAWPEGCNAIDIINDGLYSFAPYVKGALFLRSLEAKIGRNAIDDSLASFYNKYRGKAAGMQSLLTHIKNKTGYDPTQCANQWLRSADIPDDERCL